LGEERFNRLDWTILLALDDLWVGIGRRAVAGLLPDPFRAFLCRANFDAGLG
jgi:hypothetical protein